MGKQKNILEESIRYLLDRSLSLRFDICTCSKCREEMMRFLIDKLPGVYMDTDDPAYREAVKEAGDKYWKEIFSEIANAVEKVNKNLPHSIEDDKEKAFDALLGKIKEDRGVDFSKYHRNILKRRIALRLNSNKIKSYVEYLHLLAVNSQEYERLFDVLTINISDFFRDSFVWAALKRVLKEIIAAHNSTKEPITLWSAGCAKGEEPYSLAVLFQEIGNIKVPFKIYATDIDKENIEEAKAGIYDTAKIEKAVVNSSQDSIVFNLKKYFIFKNDKYYINDELKKFIEFKYLDLTSLEYIKGVDMILCRNVFIYFTKALQESITDRFYKSLNDKGYMVIGGSESLVSEAKLIFRPIISIGSGIYQKINV